MQILPRRVVLALAVWPLAGCGGGPVGDRVEPAPLSGREVVDGLLIRGGTVVRRRGPDEHVDLLLARYPVEVDTFLVLTAIAGPGEYAATDTLDATGLYVHAADPFDPVVETTPSLSANRLSIAMYVLRTGHGPGSPARWRVGAEDWVRVDPSDNRPPGPVDPRVGCYAVDRGEWSVPDPQPRTWFPDGVRLHWQYHWPEGPAKYLVATDMGGEIRGPDITGYAWEPHPGDSLTVTFGAPFQWARFEGVRRGGGYSGELFLWTDTGLSGKASARLDRAPCPDERSDGSGSLPIGRARPLGALKRPSPAGSLAPEPYTARAGLEAAVVKKAASARAGKAER